MLTTPVGGNLMRRFPERLPLCLGASVFVGGVVLTLIPSLAVIVAGLALASAGTFLSQSAATNFVAQHAAGARSAAVGLYTTWYYLGGSAGAIVPGTLWYAYGWNGVVALLIAANLAAALIALACWRAVNPAAAVACPTSRRAHASRSLTPASAKLAMPT